ncbi:MAG: hypothetical protein IJY36_02370 [Coprobacter sp.]|nr:hypothetical protein [Coprobacter sp.]
MALWKISVKNNLNMGGGKQLVKGMFVEMALSTNNSPVGVSRYQELMANAFNTKYSVSIDKSRMNSSYLTAEKIG